MSITNKNEKRNGSFESRQSVLYEWAEQNSPFALHRCREKQLEKWGRDLRGLFLFDPNASFSNLLLETSAVETNKS
jgi:hypothetical protein